MKINPLRLDLDEASRPPTPGRLVTLRIKTEAGDEVLTEI